MRLAADGGAPPSIGIAQSSIDVTAHSPTSGQELLEQAEANDAPATSRAVTAVALRGKDPDFTMPIPAAVPERVAPGTRTFSAWSRLRRCPLP